MNLLDDPRNRGITTLVCFHDLLGFGELLSSSGGSLDSAVGEIAYRRIVGLQASIAEVKDDFPAGTQFFHFNDTVAAYLDTPTIAVRLSHTDAGIVAKPPGRGDMLTLLQFLGASARLHQKSIEREENERIGPAGRTFVVIGQRWDVASLRLNNVIDVPQLEANLAFAEAYRADVAGSRAGFSHANVSRMYINDQLQFLFYLASVSLSPEQLGWLTTISTPEEQFPQNIYTRPIQPIVIETFHRKREYYSVQAHYAANIPRALIRAEGANSASTA